MTIEEETRAGAAPTEATSVLSREVAALYKQTWGRGPRSTNVHWSPLTATVQRTTGRRVRTVLSATRLDPDLSAELFLLEPADQ